MARAARSGAAAPESTAQDWAMESMRHSSLDRRAQRRAVVEPGAAVPVAVPGLALERQRAGLRRWDAPRAPRCARRRAPRRRARTAADLAIRNQPSQTLSPWPLLADPVHAVIPVAAADQRQAVAPRSPGSRRAPARSARRGWRTSALAVGSKEALGLRPAQAPAPSMNGTASLEHGGVAGRVDVVRDGVRQPERDRPKSGCARPGRVGQPPVLDIAFGELPGGRAQQVLARDRRAAASPGP